MGAVNRRSRKSIVALVALACASFSAVSRAESETGAKPSVTVGEFRFTPKLEIRVRGEYRRDPPDMGGVSVRGVPSPRVRDALALHERARLGVSVERPYLRADITLQDARVFGASQPFATLKPDGGFASFGAYEAFLEVHDEDPRPNLLRVGRQTVRWGDGLLLGRADASPTGRSLDAVRARWAKGPFEAEALAVVVDASRPLGLAFDDASGPSRLGTQLYGLRAGVTFGPLLGIEAYGFARVARSAGSAPDGTRFAAARAAGETYTASLRVAGDDRGLSYAAQGAVQFGRASAFGLSGVDRFAYAAEAHVAKTFDTLVLRPTFLVGGALASGDDGGTTYTQFDPLLPDVGDTFGATSLVAWSNVRVLRARVTTHPHDDVTAGVTWQMATFAEPGAEWLNGYLLGVGGFAGQPSRALGHEIDARVVWAPWPAFDVAATYSLFALGDGAKNVVAERGRGDLRPNGTVAVSPVAHFGELRATLRIP
ncbi:MAG: alginate export family protein [Polyangiaceae bacterium]